MSATSVKLFGPFTRYMPTLVAAPGSGATKFEPTMVTSAYAVCLRKAMSTTPPAKMGEIGRPLANVVTVPVSGSTREIRPTSASVTYSAPSGPTVLPGRGVNPSRADGRSLTRGRSDLCSR
jgi:hypothetical protein